MKKYIKFLHHKLQGLSFHWSDSFLHNLVVVIGIVFVWRGMWNLLDTYFFPEHELFSNILSVVIGIVLVYLSDGTIEQLGGWSPEKVKEKLSSLRPKRTPKKRT